MSTENVKQTIEELIDLLNYWTEQYDEGKPVVSDQEWDETYFYLVHLECAYGIYLPNSPTQRIHYKTVTQLNKVKHNHPMLSLDKTKDLKEVQDFLQQHNYIAMCKMDGLTCSLRYLNGKLVGAETRGDGTVGEDVLHNALVINSIPKYIDYKEELVVDGEIICTRDNFKNFDTEYKNPRNFAAGSIRLLNSKECEKRNLTFVAWDVVKGLEDSDSLSEKLECLYDLNFKIVPYILPLYYKEQKTTTLEEQVQILLELAYENSYPIDGLVFKFDSCSYSKTLGQTEHHFKNALAYKFADDLYTTNLKEIEWTLGRTGVLTPVAVFDPIDIDGTIVSRASLHNVSIMESLLGLPYSCQELQVYKSNMIIPQIYSAEKQTPPEDTLSPEYFGFFPVIDECPICGLPTKIIENNGVKILKCTNPNCEGKLINRLDHYCGKKGLDIKGLSTATLEKLINWNWVNSISDLYKLKDYQKDWMQKPGFGEKSVTKILDAIEQSKECELWRFISAFGIPLVGNTYAKQIAKEFNNYNDFYEAIKCQFNFAQWDGFGEEITFALLTFDYSEMNSLIDNGTITVINTLSSQEMNNSLSLENIIVVITGKLKQYKNRDALKADIEAHGGKVAGSVSSKTNYLINNDNTSQSSKNKAAKAAGIPILTESEFIEKFLTN